MLMPILLLVSLFALLGYGWAAGRWRWGWLCWPVPAAPLVWMLVFLSGLQRNWDGSYHFLCVLKQLTAEVSGQAELLGFGSGNPITDENYTRGCFTSFCGEALAVLRAGYETGTVRLRVRAEGLEGAEVTLRIKGAAEA